MNSTHHAIWLSTAAWLALSTPAYAEAPSAPDAAEAAPQDDIVVTAERRKTDLQKTAIAISAFAPEALRDRNITNVRDLAGQIPNLYVARVSISHTTQTFSLRGVGEADPIQEPVLAIYVDDVYQPRQIGNGLEFNDIERIEVLRGPQGTLYGRNSSAGALRIITRDPDATTRAKGEISYGSFNQIIARGSISGALLGDTLTGSLAYVHNSRDGVTYAPTLKHDVNRINLDALKGKLRFTGIEGLDAQLTLSITRDRSDTRSYIPVNQPGTFNPRLSYSEVEPLQHLNQRAASLRLTYTLSPHLTLKSVSGFTGFDLNPVWYENDGQADLIQKNLIHYNDRAITQELQLNGDYGALTFSTGLFYLHESFFVQRDGFSRTGALTNSPISSQRAQNITTTDAYAIFGEGTYRFTPVFSLTAGLRGTLERKRFDFDNKVLDINGNITAQSIAGSATKSWSAATPKVALNAQWTRDLLTYLSWSKGFKSGGFDNRATRLDLATLPFNPEHVTTYEGGIKASLFEQALRSNIAVFYNDYRDLQVSFYDPAYVGSRRGNAGKAHSWGVEVENSLRLSSRLSVQASGGYLKAVYDDYKGAGGNGVNADGKVLTNAPQWSFSGGATYTAPIGATGSLKLNANAQYQSSFYTSALNRVQDLVPGQAFVNGSIVWTPRNEHFQIAVEGKNLFGAGAPVTSSYTPSTGVYFKNFPDPATFLVSLRASL